MSSMLSCGTSELTSVLSSTSNCIRCAVAISFAKSESLPFQARLLGELRMRCRRSSPRTATVGAPDAGNCGSNAVISPIIIGPRAGASA